MQKTPKPKEVNKFPPFCEAITPGSDSWKFKYLEPFRLQMSLPCQPKPLIAFVLATWFLSPPML